MSDQADLDSLPAAAPGDRRGAWVGRYVLLERIAEGGMGVVYAAFDSRLDRKVAVKLLRPMLARGENSAEAEARLLREAQAMARLSHPNVVTVHDVGIVEGNVFLAMEFVEGGTLKQRLYAGATWREGLALLKQAGRGLAAAHAAGLVHRDFKPDNVLVGADGRVRVTDFGIARADGAEDPVGGDPSASARARRASSMAKLAASTPMQQPASTLWSSARSMTTPAAEGATPSPSLSDRLTATGDLLGTVGYMAPEQAFGEQVDARSDQFSFCATLYLALYRERPFLDQDLDTYLLALCGPVREPPSGSKVPPWLRRAVLKGLSAQPVLRYASMVELLAALDRDPAVKRRRWMVAGAAALLAGTAAGFVVHAGGARIAPCGPAEADLSGAWDPGVEADVRRAFEASGSPTRVDSFDRTARALAAYAAGWRAARLEVCEATRVRHEQAEDVYALRVDCLDREKQELRALTSLFRRADAAEVSEAVKAAYGLDSVTWCQDVNALRAAPGLPVEPTKRAQVMEARAALASAASLGLAGKNAEALAEGDRARRTAREAGHRGTEAEALCDIGYNRQRLGDYEGSVDDLSAAMATAYAARDDAVFVRAASKLAFIVGDKLYRPADAHRLLDLARAGLERVGGSEVLEADVLSTDAVLHLTEGHPEQAAPMLERVVGAYKKTIGQSPLTAMTLNNLGYAEHLSGRNEAALVPLGESLSMLESLFGSDRLLAGIPLVNLGAAHLGLGQVAEGERILRRTFDVFDRQSPDGFWSAWTLQYLALAARLDGDLPGAVAYGRRGLAIADKLGSSQRLVPGLTVTTGDALVASGAPEEGLALCERALEIHERLGLMEASKVYEWDALRCRGEALVALGRTGEGRGALERSVALTRRVFPWDLARARLALAKVVVGEDPARAEALAREAEGELGALPELKGFAGEVEGWLRERREGAGGPRGGR